MDSEFREIKGGAWNFRIDPSLTVRISNNVPVGTHVVTKGYVFVNPCNDLVWDTVYQNFIAHQRQTGKVYVEQLLANLADTFGL